MSLQPTRTQVHAMRDALHAGTAYTPSATVKADLTTMIGASSLAAVATLIDVNDSSLQRYMDGVPYLADTLAVELMTRSYQELNP